MDVSEEQASATLFASMSVGAGKHFPSTCSLCIVQRRNLPNRAARGWEHDGADCPQPACAIMVTLRWLAQRRQRVPAYEVVSLKLRLRLRLRLWLDLEYLGGCAETGSVARRCTGSGCMLDARLIIGWVCMFRLRHSAVLPCAETTQPDSDQPRFT
jgi:hypothetical protein